MHVPRTRPLSNVETLQSSLDAAEGRATQLATRLAEVEAEAAEAVPRAEELGRWQALMQRMQPGGSGPEALQRVVEALQRDVAARADACTKAQARAAELQGACSFVGVLCFLVCIEYIDVAASWQVR